MVNFVRVLALLGKQPQENLQAGLILCLQLWYELIIFLFRWRIDTLRLRQSEICSAAKNLHV